MDLEKMSEEKSKIDNIELRSEEFLEILGHVPNWITRWGITVIFIIIVVLLIGSWFFKYPRVITSPVVVTTENPPSHIMARASGKIEVLFVDDNDKVNPNDSIAIIENAANHNHLFTLKTKLETYKINNPEFLDISFFEDQLNLGEIQNSYNNFLKKFKDFKNYKTLDYHTKKINSLKEELKKHETYFRGLKRQETILKKEYSLAQKQFSRDSIIFTEKVTSDAEFEQSQSTLLQKRYSFEQANISLTSTRITISKINQSVLDLELDYSEKNNQYQLSLVEAYDNLDAQIALWEKQYVLRSPIEGIVTFNNIWSKNQNVKSGDVVISVIPENSGEIIGKISMQSMGSGKVKVGQRVNIKFHNFPYMEYGMVKGYVKTISLVPDNNSLYTVEVELPEGLKTFYNTELKFSQEMEGIAEIITEDKRLIEEVIDPIKYILKKNMDN